MQTLTLPSRRGDGHLWMIALGLSMAVNLVLVAAVGFAALESALLRKAATPAPPPQAGTVATIYAEPAETAKAAETAPGNVLEKRFARTSPDQAETPEKSTAFIGERNTRATSDRAPIPAAPPLPSQSGIAPRDETDIETTESNYQDGELAAATPPATMAPAPPAAATATEQPDPPGPDEPRRTPPPRAKLLDGPHPVDVQVPQETATKEEIKPAPAKHPAAATPPEPKPAEITKAADTPKNKPAFKGFQRKTAVVGSISRTGRSALDVEDSALGRYQAAISRAVELEWQRNCVRHRDFITPGFLTVRFFVEPGGKVRSVQFVGDMETGEVQKGFTLNSIRDAGIPVMPQALRKEYDTEPLELIFRFFF